MRRFTGRALPVLVFLWAMFLAGCGKVGLPFPGQVVDAETGRPIEGAFVLALWKGEVGLFDAQPICYHMEMVVSDEEGRFRVPGWFGGGHFGVMNTYVSTKVYARGYRMIKARHGNTLFSMDKQEGDRLDRISYIYKTYRQGMCGTKGGDIQIYRLARAGYEEARDLFRAGDKLTSEEVQLIRELHRYAAQLNVDPYYELPPHVREERIKVYVKDNP